MRLLRSLRARRWREAAGVAIVGALASLVISLALEYLLDSLDVPKLHTLFFRTAFPVVLATTLLFYIGLKRYDLALLRQEFVQRAMHDGLTECLNGPLFSTLVDAYAGEDGADDEEPRGALLIVDADHFRSINERFGYSWGDQALRVIAGTIRTCVRSGDLVGRIGGQEFGVFLPGASRANAEEVAERIRTAVAAVYFAPNEMTYPLTVSVGAVLFEHEVQFEELFRLADRRLRLAKAAGRNRVEYLQMHAGEHSVTPTAFH